MIDFYTGAISNINRFNRYGWNAWAYDELPLSVGIKAYVISHLKPRRQPVERMIRAVGFVDVEFPQTRHSRWLNVDVLVASGVVSTTFSNNILQRHDVAASQVSGTCAGF